jgi:hypothetical protein
MCAMTHDRSVKVLSNLNLGKVQSTGTAREPSAVILTDLHLLVASIFLTLAVRPNAVQFCASMRLTTLRLTSSRD